MRFGTVDLFIDMSEWSFRMGRPVVNEEFLKALLLYGSYDEYHFFCPDINSMEIFKNRLQDIIPDPKCLPRVNVSLQIALSETLKEKEFHIFHMGDFTRYMPSMIWMRNKFSVKPFPITGTTHSLDDISMNVDYLRLMFSGIKKFDRIICTSKTAQNTIKKRFQYLKIRLSSISKSNFLDDLIPYTSLIPLGIGEDFFEEVDRNYAKDFLNIPKDKVVMLSVGRYSLRSKADWSPLLETLSYRLNHEMLDNFLFIIAGGATEEEIKLMESMLSIFKLRDYVILFPNFKPEVKRILYAASDIFISIVDNFQETFGLNILEAMASGLPIIASDFNGYRDHIEDGRNGFLIPTYFTGEIPEFLEENFPILNPSIRRLYMSQLISHNMEYLWGKIKLLMENQGLRAEMGKESKRIARRYGWKEIIKRYEDLWKELLEECKGLKDDTAFFSDIYIDYAESKIFNHYTTEIINDECRVGITAYGQELYRLKILPLIYEDINVSLFKELLSLLMESVYRNQICSIKELKDIAYRELEATYRQTLFHIQYLLKHGVFYLDGKR